MTPSEKCLSAAQFAFIPTAPPRRQINLVGLNRTCGICYGDCKATCQEVNGQEFPQRLNVRRFAHDDVASGIRVTEDELVGDVVGSLFSRLVHVFPRRLSAHARKSRAA